jgi:outer membrane protein assembly factor BamD
MTGSRIVSLTILLAGMLVLSACDSISRQFDALFGSTSSEYSTGDAFDIPPQVLASNAETAYRDGNYDAAAELYQQLKDRFPYSRYALLAELRLGDAYLKASRYEEAATAYDEFIRLHPRNEAVPYAIYQMGMTYHAQILTPDRDPSAAAQALDVFKRLRANYPNDAYSIQAAPRMEECIANLASHNILVGDYYRNQERYEAAIGRYRQVITQFPDAGYYNEAMGRIKECEDILAAMSPEEREERNQNRREIFVPPPSMMGITGIISPTAIGF